MWCARTSFAQKQSDRCACGVLAPAVLALLYVFVYKMCAKHTFCRQTHKEVRAPQVRAHHMRSDHSVFAQKKCEHTTCAAITLFLHKKGSVSTKIWTVAI